MLKITLSWDMVRKVWVLQWQTKISDKAVTQHRRLVDTTEPIDQIAANSIARAIEFEMRSWLPFSDGC